MCVFGWGGWGGCLGGVFGWGVCVWQTPRLLEHRQLLAAGASLVAEDHRRISGHRWRGFLGGFWGCLYVASTCGVCGVCFSIWILKMGLTGTFIYIYMGEGRPSAQHPSSGEEAVSPAPIIRREEAASLAPIIRREEAASPAPAISIYIYIYMAVWMITMMYFCALCLP